MNTDQLAKVLRDMYDSAPRGRQVTMIHFFGIKYANDLSNLSIREVVEQSGIKSTYVTEVNKGVNLAAYVTPQ